MLDSYSNPNTQSSLSQVDQSSEGIHAIFATDTNQKETVSTSADPPYWCPPGTEQMSRLINGFTRFELLGQGGMGAVYRAEQTSLNRPVAIKLLNPHLSSHPAFVRQFEGEAKILAKLSHDGIVKVFEHGKTRLGDVFYYFIVMEFVDGANLEQLSKDGTLNPDRAVKFILEAATALQEVHECGVIHRDLKPSNIVVQERKNRAVVVDFGLARISPTVRSAFTQAEIVAGSGPFSAPEQLHMGPPERIGSWTDVYSLGVTLYCLLRPGVILSSDGKKFELQLAENPRLQEIIRKATEHDASERYQTMRDFARAISNLGSGASPRIGPASSPRLLGPPPLPSEAPPLPRARKAPTRLSSFVFPRWRKRYLYVSCGFVVLGISSGWLFALFLSMSIMALLIPEIPFRWRVVTAAAFLLSWQGVRIFKTSTVSNPSDATAARPFENTMGMKFVPIPGKHVLIAVQATDDDSFNTWSIEQPDSLAHLVRMSAGRDGAKGIATGVNWAEANAFAAWLSNKEGRRYRLPTKQEWLAAVGPKGISPMTGSAIRDYDETNKPNSLGIEPLLTAEWCFDRAELDEQRRLGADILRKWTAEQSKAANRDYHITCLGIFLGDDRAEVGPSEAPWDERAIPDLSKPAGQQGAEGGLRGFGFRCVLEIE